MSGVVVLELSGNQEAPASGAPTEEVRGSLRELAGASAGAAGQVRLLPVLLVAAAVLIAGCGGGASSSGPANAPPVAHAGADRSVDAGAQVRLAGRGEDRDGTIARYRWRQLSGPRVQLADAAAAGTEFAAPEFVENDARLVFRLTVTDDDGATAEDEVVITILPPPAPGGHAASPQLPANTVVPTPWHMTNVRVTFDRAPAVFESFCITFRAEGEVAEGVNLYFSPFNSTLNRLNFYGGVQTRIDGHNSGGGFVARGRGAIFSRWRERDTAAVMRAQGGLIESSGHEGDFISVRNDFAWGEGRYRLCLRQSGHIEGSPLPADYDASDVAFAWGRYEHTWVRMEATDLDTDTTVSVGALAVPGRTLALGEDNTLFVEIYAFPSPFPAERVPELTITVEEFAIDGASLPYRTIESVSNPIPETGREPKMTHVSFDMADRLLVLEVGRFAGRFGKVRRSVLPARPAVESASLVTAGGARFIRAIWDGRILRSGDLPAGRVNLRAELADPSAVGSVRLVLDGAASLARLANHAPYLLSVAGSGFTLGPGNYTLAITPYSEPDGAGVPGARLTARFSVAAGTSSTAIASSALQAHIEAALGIPLSPANVDAAMKRLTRLEVHGGTVDRLDGLEKAVNLRDLRLSGHRVSDLSPLMQLRQLTILDMAGNRIRTVAPLASLKQLRELDIARNAVDSLTALASLTRLRMLDASDNRVDSLVPLAGLTQLQSLDASGNRVSRLTALASLTRLRMLDVSDNRVDSLVPLAGLTQLRSLDVSGNRVSRLTALAGLVALRRLAVSGNRVESVAALGGLTGLAGLDISHNRVAHLAPLSGLPALARLDLSHNRIVDVRPLAGLTRLSRLSIGFNRISDPGALEPLAANGTQIVGREEQLRANRPPLVVAGGPREPVHGG